MMTSNQPQPHSLSIYICRSHITAVIHGGRTSTSSGLCVYVSFMTVRNVHMAVWVTAAPLIMSKDQGIKPSSKTTTNSFYFHKLRESNRRTQKTKIKVLKSNNHFLVIF